MEQNKKTALIILAIIFIALIAAFFVFQKHLLFNSNVAQPSPTQNYSDLRKEEPRVFVGKIVSVDTKTHSFFLKLETNKDYYGGEQNFPSEEELKNEWKIFINPGITRLDALRITGEATLKQEPIQELELKTDTFVQVFFFLKDYDKARQTIYALGVLVTPKQ